MSSDQPKISVIVPVYRAEKYLRDALLSVQRQTFKDWECIVVDDGSPDGSVEIAKEFVAQDVRFRLIQQPNSGGEYSRNTGHDAARGEWLLFLDNDDYYHPQAMEIFIRIAAAHPDVDVVDGEYTRVNEMWSPEKTFLEEEIQEGNVAQIPSYTYYNHTQLLKCFANFPHCYFGTAWNSLVRRSALGDLRHPKSYPTDMPFRFRAIARLRGWAYVHYKTYFYRNTPGSIINAKIPPSRWMEIAKTLELLLQDCVAENHFTGRLLRDFRKSMSTRVKMYYYGALRRQRLNEEDIAAILEALRYLESHQFPLYRTIPILRRFQFWLFVKTGRLILLRKRGLK